MNIKLLPLFIIIFLSLQASSLTLHDLTEDSVPLYPTGSIPLDSVRPEHVNIVGVSRINDGIGDFNGDGINDIVMSKNDFLTAVVVFGVQGGLPEYSVKPELDEKDGVKIVLEDYEGYCMSNVKFIGDVNGDGLTDLLAIIEPTSNRPGERKAFIVYGSKSPPSVVDVSKSTRVPFSDTYFTGTTNVNPKITFAGIRDVNGDGLDDFVISSVVRMFVFFGRKSLSPTLVSYNDVEDKIKGFSITDESAATGFSSTCLGGRITTAGDFNGDGYADIMMSTVCNANSDEAKVYIIYGQEMFPETFPLKFLNNLGYPTGLIIESQIPKSYFGTTVVPIGDFNGDSMPDVMISSMLPQNYGDYETNIGGAYILFGQKSLSGTISQGLFDSREDLGVFISGAGYQIVAIGDLNKDKYSDILVARKTFASVIYGGPNFKKNFPISSINGINGFNITIFPSDFWYNDMRTVIQEIAGLGDINGDSIPDFGITYGSVNYHIIMRDLPKTKACIDSQFCLKSEANKYLESTFCNYGGSTVNSKTKKEEANVYTVPTAPPVDSKTKEETKETKVDTMSAGLYGFAIGVGISALLFVFSGIIKKWHKKGKYIQLQREVISHQLGSSHVELPRTKQESSNM